MYSFFYAFGGLSVINPVRQNGIGQDTTKKAQDNVPTKTITKAEEKQMKNIADYLNYVRTILLNYMPNNEAECLITTVERCIANMSPDEKAEYGIPEGV